MGYNPNIFLLMPKIIWDVDALLFIAAEELATGLSMGSVQKNAINNLYKRLKNTIATPNGSVLYPKFILSNARIWVQCPVNDSTANAAAYNIELMSKSTLGVFNGFVSGDYTTSGITGGTAGKYFDAGISPNSYPLNDICDGVYIRTVATSATYPFGTIDGSSNGAALILRSTSGTATGFQVNDATVTNFSGTVALNKGLILLQRASSTAKTVWRNGVQTNTTNVTSTSLTTNNYYFHGLNNNGAAGNYNNKQICSYFVGLPSLTANEHADLSWIINLYQTEVITGGRQV